jgi:hypothetical protein
MLIPRAVGSEILNSLAFLSQIKRLRLHCIGISLDQDVAAMQRLSGLRSLQVRFDSRAHKIVRALDPVINGMT